MTDSQDEEKHHWIVMFNERGRVYPYLSRTVPHMSEMVGKFYREHGRYPYRVWAIVGGEIQKVVIEG